VPEDYLEIHDFMDSSKSAMADSRHRALTHNAWFVGPGGPLERCFGHNITNSDGRQVSVREVGEQHVLEDYAGRFIPSPQDFLSHMDMQEWMVSGLGEAPPSCVRLRPTDRTAARKRMTID
jgi:hypothetical protein